MTNVINRALVAKKNVINRALAAKTKILFLAVLCCVMMAKAEEQLPPSNEIWYQSSDHQVITPNKAYAFDATILSNTYYAEADKGVITFDGNVTTIGDMAFSLCSSLRGITIPASVTSIGVGAFEYCESLNEITIPASVTSIGENAFYYCSRLDETNYIGTIADWCKIKFTNIDANPLSWSVMLYINDVEVKNLVIPQGVETIGDFAFARCGGFLESIAFEGNLCQNNIAESAFLGVDARGSIDLTLPDSWGNMYLPIDSNTPWHGAKFESNRYYSIATHKEEAIAAIETEVAKVTDWLERETEYINNYKSRITNVENDEDINNKNDIENLKSDILSNISQHENRKTAMAAINEVMGDYSETEGLYMFIATEIDNIIAATESGTITTNKNAALAKLPTAIAHYQIIYAEAATELLGSMAEPCDGCPAVKVTKGDTEIILYAPNQVEFLKTEPAEE